jgi:drug/metabolite transporter (DMT)-like permease
MTSTISDSLAADRSGRPVVVRGFAWASLSVAILSGWFVVTRLGLSHELGIWDVIALRFGEGAVLLTPTLLISRSRLPLAAWLSGIPLSILWGAPFIFLVGTGLRLTSAALASSIAPALMPIFAGIFLWMIRGQIPRRVELLGYSLILVGLIVLVRSHASTEGHVDPIGILSLVVAAAMWASYTLRLKASGLSSVQATALICFWSAIFYVPIYLGCGLSNLARASLGELLFQSVYQGILMSVVAVLSFNRAVASLGPRAAAAIVALIPVTTTVFAIPVLGEFPMLAASLSICGIAVGVMLAATPAKAKSSIIAKGETA